MGLDGTATVMGPVAGQRDLMAGPIGGQHTPAACCGWGVGKREWGTGKREERGGKERKKKRGKVKKVFEDLDFFSFKIFFVFNLCFVFIKIQGYKSQDKSIYVYPCLL